MKRIILTAILCASLSFSCSEDKDENTEIEASTLVGVWSFTKIEAPDLSGELKLSNDILTVLVATGCDILNYDFKADLTVTASLRDFTETGRDINSGGSGLLIECPSNVLTTSSTWELNGNQLTFMEANGLMETITIEIDGDTLTVPGEVINADNLTGTKAIFKRQ